VFSKLSTTKPKKRDAVANLVYYYHIPGYGIMCINQYAVKYPIDDWKNIESNNPSTGDGALSSELGDLKSDDSDRNPLIRFGHD
jgi:hypothetical protein